jgi:hypothetical protein
VTNLHVLGRCLEEMNALNAWSSVQRIEISVGAGRTIVTEQFIVHVHLDSSCIISTVRIIHLNSSHP